ncbi:MAG: tetratricopeptide repeat protein [Sphingomonadaceae bacterium]
MRFAAPAAALSLLVAVTSSVSLGAEREPRPEAALLIAKGDSALNAGDTQLAIDQYEAALVVDPSYALTFMHLAEAARQEGMQGKAIYYYREVLNREPGNIPAIAGEGMALAEKGAIEKAQRNLANLRSMCGNNCSETSALADAIQRGPKPHMLAAETVLPDTSVTQN